MYGHQYGEFLCGYWDLLKGLTDNRGNTIISAFSAKRIP